MCTGKCNECINPCSLSEIAPQLQKQVELKKKEDGKMSLGNCHAEDGEKIGRLDERGNASKTLLWITLATSVFSLFVGLSMSVIALFVAWTAMRDIAATQERLYRAETEQKELYKKCEEAERDYNSARSSISQLRSKRSKN